MTNAEINYIIRHRKAGKGCAEIARTLGLSANTVKSFCRRNSIVPNEQESPADSAETKCLQCGKVVIRSPHRKAKRFCSDTCRLAWWHSHRDLARNALERRCHYCVMVWCCTIKVDIGNSKGQYIEKDEQEATKDDSESTKIQHGI